MVVFMKMNRESLMTRTLLIPGIDGSPEPHWQAWWQAKEPNTLTIHQDDWSNPTPEAWEAESRARCSSTPVRSWWPIRWAAWWWRGSWRSGRS